MREPRLLYSAGMSDPSESRAEELEQQLQDQPGSRLFVQLAEEYRRLERYDDAVRTLEKGLEDQPTYVSARVLLGRCRLESGDPAGAIPELEQALRQDQTHLLAHKLLARAHLETGDVEAARERLSLYEMLNESDPEIEELRARLPGGGDDGEAQVAAETPAAEAAASPEPVAVEDEPVDEDLFDLGAPPPAAPAAEDDDLLGVWEADSEAEPSATPEAPPAQEPPPAGGDDPFGDLWTADDRQRLDHGLAAEGLFGEPLETAPEEPTEPEEPAEVAGVVEEPEEPEERATVTLGRLYLQQGHQDEARRIFREVLDREPDHTEARAELLRLDAPPEPEREVSPAVPEPETPSEPEGAAAEPLTAADLEGPGARSLGLTERKVRMLDSYLQRIRQAAEQHVR